MDSICRLCSSTKLVNNYLFDEETALNLKMELFLPIKIMKGDELPQKVCNRCSCKVNDIYQFCNFAIETQDRLRSMVLQMNHNSHESVDLTLTKQEPQQHIPIDTVKTEQATQTDELNKLEVELKADVQLKIERSSVSPSIIKRESSVECDVPSNIPSDDSEDLSLILLKKKKRGCKPNSNGEDQPKKTRKKKSKGNVITLVDPIEVIQNDRKDRKDRKVKRELEDVEVYQCCICFNLYYLRSDMLQHYRQHVTEIEEREAPAPPPHTDRCSRCRKQVDASSWASHWARHCARDLRPYRCALCEKAFRSPTQILKHGMTHKPGEPDPLQKRFVCDLCPEGFVYMRYLLAHRSRAHPEAAGRAVSLRCAQCSRSFAHLNSLRRHLRAHSGERNFLCSVCGKALSSREHLKFHLRIHTGYKPNVCKTCGKGFVKKCNLTLHERVHSGEKPHVCSHCGKAFSQRSTLVIHERYHSGARPYSCELCGRGFVAKGLLSMHLKTTCI